MKTTRTTALLPTAAALWLAALALCLPPTAHAQVGTRINVNGSNVGVITLAGALDISFSLANIQVGDFFTLISNLGGGAIAGDFGQVLAWGRAMTDEGGGIFSLDGLRFQLSKVADSSAESLTGGHDLALPGGGHARRAPRNRRRRKRS